MQAKKLFAYQKQYKGVFAEGKLWGQDIEPFSGQLWRMN